MKAARRYKENFELLKVSIFLKCHANREDFFAMRWIAEPEDVRIEGEVREGVT